jgi:uroporphyrinogen decarboxylase
MTSKERVQAALSLREPDRIPMHDSPWSSTIERWRKEGMPADANVADHFGFEMLDIGADTSPMCERETLEETEDRITYRTAYGGIRRDRKDLASVPEVIESPVKTRDDWERIKPKLVVSEARLDWEAAAKTYDKAQTEQKYLSYGAAVGYDKIQSYVSSEQLLMLTATDPDWVIDMYETDAQLAMDCYDMIVARGFDFDGAFLYCDMGWRGGMLFSPKAYRETSQHVFKGLCDHFKRDRPDMKVLLHSCGHVAPIIPDLIEAGIDCIQPLEVKAGMDLVALKREYGDRIAFMGGIDVRAMAAGGTRLEEEIASKVPIAKAGGGYIYHSDHSVPDNVSYSNYLRTLELVREYGAY